MSCLNVSRIRQKSCHTLTFLLSSTTETLPIFISERPILLRESSSGMYRLSSHLTASTFVFLPYLLLISLLYTTSLYFLTGLCLSYPTLLAFVSIVWAVVLTANSMLLLASSLAPDYIAGTSLVTVSLAGFFLFSGYFISKGRMPEYWLFMYYFSPFKCALDALLANEYGCASSTCFERRNDGECEVTGAEVMKERGLRGGEQWEDVQI